MVTSNKLVSKQVSQEQFESIQNELLALNLLTTPLQYEAVCITNL